MTDLVLYKKIIENFKSMSLKEALKMERVGTKKFYSLMKEFPTETEEYNKIVKLKRGGSRPKALRTFNDEVLEEIKKKYLDGISLQELTKQYKSSYIVLKRVLKNNVIQLRKQDELNKLQGLKKCPIKSDDEWRALYDIYLKQRSLHKVCAQFHTSCEVAMRNLRRLGLPLIKGSFNSCYKTKQGIKYLFESDWDYLYNYYKDHSISQTVEYCGLSRRSIYHIFKQLGYKKRSLQEERDLRRSVKGERTFKELKEYLTEYTFMEPYKGITKNGKFLKYEIRHDLCGRIFRRTLHDPMSIRCVHCYPKSKGENFIADLLSNYVDVLRGDRSIIYPQELDIYIPSLNVAIEFNGRFWHNENVVGKTYHKVKTEECLKKGVKLYHFWEGQKREIIESRVNQLLGLSSKIYARQTTICQVKSNERKEFFEKFHISGDTFSSFSFGLEHNGKLVSVMSFRKCKGGLEIARYSSILNTVVVGGFSKLFKHALDFIKVNYPEVDKIITYCNRDWTADYHDSVYFKNGFSFIKDSGPILSYYNYNLGKTESREKYQKHKLQKIFSDYAGQNVNEFLKSKGILRMYNSGNWKFEWRINEN